MLERGKHKGENGNVLIIGGSKEYVGCLGLAGLASLRTGADLAFIACPEKAGYALNSYSPDLITIKLPGDYLDPAHFDIIKPWIDKASVLVLGTGSGKGDGARSLYEKVLHAKKPKVIDADALKILDPFETRNAILTPNPYEYKVMFGEEPSKKGILRNSRPDRVILVKGEIDIISDGKNVYENKTGNPGMTVGGTGDTLAGIVAGLIGQGASLIDSALLGARINGVAGDLAFEDYGYGLVASDLLDYIPGAMKKAGIC